MGLLPDGAVGDPGDRGLLTPPRKRATKKAADPSTRERLASLTTETHTTERRQAFGQPPSGSTPERVDIPSRCVGTVEGRFRTRFVNAPSIPQVDGAFTNELTGASSPVKPPPARYR